MESVPLFDLTETIPAYGTPPSALSRNRITGSSDLAAVILEAAEPYRLTDDEGGFRPSLPAKICVEPWALRPLKRKAHDNDGMAQETHSILYCSNDFQELPFCYALTREHA